ncbi:hypothetical protein L202_05111 [Cryptococcus amylolentus CBS 6039]|uniref:Uncharacterized protein n=2 Tax=Cryptococcus amylolentus TaxID=104669 RepID=A0A1E3HNW2_9TREE|nr:hypothetical protein L202_05111 [Cryptococcus amylolentus CBS 6039]ODN78027.1 hypothetical protein L202_05111 [Cryptococcus amylolentus CBS 6039]ODO05974.1 hypothetical protein I350_05035 [Cryptococcus amylolentus CBS 6273]
MSESDYDGEEISFIEAASILLSAPGWHRKTRKDLDEAETARTSCKTDLEAKKTYASDLDTQINLAKERINEFPSQDSEMPGVSNPDRTTHGNASKSRSRRLAPRIPWNPLERYISSPYRHEETEIMLEESIRDMDYLRAQHMEQDSGVGDRLHELSQLWTQLKWLEGNSQVSIGTTEAGFTEKEAKQG